MVVDTTVWVALSERRFDPFEQLLGLMVVHPDAPGRDRL
jgi:hypothetical protein